MTEIENNILIVVDMQNDFVTGQLGSDKAKAIVPRIINKINENNDTVILTQDTHDKNYADSNEGKHLPVKHCIRDTKGWLLVEDIALAADKKEYGHTCTVRKHTFGSEKLIRILKNRIHEDRRPNIDDQKKTRIVLVGVCTDICVLANAILLKTAFPEAEIIVDASCCAGTSDEAHNAALTAMKSCQITVAY